MHGAGKIETVLNGLLTLLDRKINHNLCSSENKKKKKSTKSYTVESKPQLLCSQ